MGAVCLVMEMTGGGMNGNESNYAYANAGLANKAVTVASADWLRKG